MTEARFPSFLGRGWSFPPCFTLGGADVVIVSDEEDIHQSLSLLFSTRQGERLLQETYGCALDLWAFSDLTYALVNELNSAIHDAVLMNEPRIRLVNVDIAPDPLEAAVLLIRLDYIVLSTNSRYNMVFPFYLKEGTAGVI